jgi:hypothetical protein
MTGGGGDGDGARGQGCRRGCRGRRRRRAESARVDLCDDGLRWWRTRRQAGRPVAEPGALGGRRRSHGRVWRGWARCRRRGRTWRRRRGRVWRGRRGHRRRNRRTGGGVGRRSCRQELVRRSNRSEHSVRCVQKLEGHRCGGVVPLSKRKGSLIKDDVSGDDYLVGRHVKTAVSFVVSRVTKKSTQGRSRSEFVGGCGGRVRIAFAAEDLEVCQGGQDATWRSPESW